MSEANFVEVVDCGVDWITVTCSDSIKAQQLVGLAAIWMQAEKHLGNEQLTWSQYGYEGFHCGQIFLGQRHDGVIVRMSGLAAWSNWKKAVALSTHVSRIDVQVTVRYQRDATQQISAHYKTAMRAKKRGDIKRSVSMFRSDDGSATLYLGKRSSEAFCRIYEKGLESKLDHYQCCVRYEIEFKNDRAGICAQELMAADDELAVSKGIVVSYLDDARICLPWLGKVTLTSIRAPTTKAGDRTSLEWLKSQVGPVIARLLERGHHDAILSSLGVVIKDGRLAVGPSPPTTQ